MKWTRMLAGLAVAGMLAGGAGAIETLALGSDASAAKVNVKLIEFKLLPSTKKVAAGKVTFVGRNAGRIPHEFVVLKTKTPAGKVPTKGAEAVETGKIGAIKTFGSGQTKILTLTLKRGHYALLCNLPGHYKAGQFADLTVT